MTAKDDSEHRVRGLDSGADDYLAKPFALARASSASESFVKHGEMLDGQMRPDRRRAVQFA
jgi:two-component system, OmpR family, copper resistance phosphate regulon response regulator CusR